MDEPTSAQLWAWREVGHLRTADNYSVPVLVCPECRALVARDGAQEHTDWHARTEGHR